MVVRACADQHDGVSATSALATLMQQTGAPEKVVLAAMERAYGRGLIECGVSLGTAWPTSSGREMLGR